MSLALLCSIFGLYSVVSSFYQLLGLLVPLTMGSTTAYTIMGSLMTKVSARPPSVDRHALRRALTGRSTGGKTTGTAPRGAPTSFSSPVPIRTVCETDSMWGHSGGLGAEAPRVPSPRALERHRPPPAAPQHAVDCRQTPSANSVRAPLGGAGGPSPIPDQYSNGSRSGSFWVACFEFDLRNFLGTAPNTGKRYFIFAFFFFAFGLLNLGYRGLRDCIPFLHTRTNVDQLDQLGLILTFYLNGKTTLYRESI